jgi:hypothetical protein
LYYDFSKHDETSLKDSLQGLTTVSILFGKLLQTIDTIFNLLATGWWFSSGILVSNKSDCHDIAEILLKEPLNTITLTL